MCSQAPVSEPQRTHLKRPLLPRLHSLCTKVTGQGFLDDEAKGTWSSEGGREILVVGVCSGWAQSRERTLGSKLTEPSLSVSTCSSGGDHGHHRLARSCQPS